MCPDNGVMRRPSTAVLLARKSVGRWMGRDGVEGLRDRVKHLHERRAYRDPEPDGASHQRDAHESIADDISHLLLPVLGRETTSPRRSAVHQ
jgi:hypothetical protein